MSLYCLNFFTSRLFRPQIVVKIVVKRPQLFTTRVDFLERLCGNRVQKRWSGERDSNPRPQLWESCALPTELSPLGYAQYSVTGTGCPRVGGYLVALPKAIRSLRLSVADVGLRGSFVGLPRPGMFRSWYSARYVSKSAPL